MLGYLGDRRTAFTDALDRWLARSSYHGEWIEWREPQTR
jgi:hypothetical protein